MSLHQGSRENHHDQDRITHKIEITSEADLERALPWLKRAYERDKG